MTELALLPQVRGDRLPGLARPQIDIVVPVHNEEAALSGSILRLHRFLSDGFPFRWRIVCYMDGGRHDPVPPHDMRRPPRRVMRHPPG